MKDKVLKRSVCRTVGKVFNVINIVLDVLFILGAVAMFILVAFIQKQIEKQSNMTKDEAIKLMQTLKTWGIVLITVGCIALVFSIITLRLLKFSVKFAPMFIFGILSILVCVSVVVGIFMIIVAFSECLSKKKKQPNLKTKK